MNFPDYSDENTIKLVQPFFKVEPIKIENNIPKIIHQIWIGKRPSPKQWMETWQKQNPDYEYILWDENKLAGEKFQNQNLIDKMPEICGKCDMMRYEILYKYGGFYLDADSECLRPFEKEMCDYDSLSCYENEVNRGGLVSNSFIGCNPNNKLMELCIKTLKEINLPISPAWWYSGPRFFTYVIQSNEYKNINILPSYAFLPEYYSGAKYTGEFLPYANHRWGTTLQKY